MTLSDRESQVLACAANGDTVEQTGRSLGCAGPTVKSHREHAMRKLGARNITQAVAIAVREGLIDFPVVST